MRCPTHGQWHENTERTEIVSMTTVCGEPPILRSLPPLIRSDRTAPRSGLRRTRLPCGTVPALLIIRALAGSTVSKGRRSPLLPCLTHRKEASINPLPSGWLHLKKKKHPIPLCLDGTCPVQHNRYKTWAFIPSSIPSRQGLPSACELCLSSLDHFLALSTERRCMLLSWKTYWTWKLQMSIASTGSPAMTALSQGWCTSLSVTRASFQYMSGQNLP